MIRRFPLPALHKPPTHVGAEADSARAAAAFTRSGNTVRPNARWAVLFGFCVCGLLSLAGCHRDMRDQPRYETFESSEFFGDDHLSARLPVPGTVARGQLLEDEALHSGKSGGNFVAEVPLEVDRKFLERGRERFNIYCSPCHARTGNGDGMIVRRGFRRPPAFHIERLRNAPAGHFFDVITNGFGAMPRYATQIEPADRWAIVAYVRVLQLSQHAELKDVPDSERKSLEGDQP